MNYFGDINLDDKITFDDVLLLYNVVNSVPGYTTNKLISDINEDGKVNFDDVVLLYNIVNSIPGYNIKLYNEFYNVDEFNYKGRNFFVRIPPENNKKYPILMLFHGFTSNSKSFYEYSKNFFLTDNILNSYIIISVDGTPCENNWNNLSGKFWNTNKSFTLQEYIDLGFTEDDVKQRKLDVDFTNIDIKWIDEFINDIINTNYNNTNNEFVICGFSNGSNFVNQILIENDNPNIKKAINLAYPLILFQYQNENFYLSGGNNRYENIKENLVQRKILIIQGEYDDVVPSNGGYGSSLAFYDCYSWIQNAYIFGKSNDKNVDIIEPEDRTEYLEINYDNNVKAILLKNTGHDLNNNNTKQLIEDFLL
jgi:predicted esterase